MNRPILEKTEPIIHSCSEDIDEQMWNYSELQDEFIDYLIGLLNEEQRKR